VDHGVASQLSKKPSIEGDASIVMGDALIVMGDAQHLTNRICGVDPVQANTP
jgi:hypothetical protein